jgi:LysR family hydrogen peroxide-inducible transcriptional activator
MPQIACEENPQHIRYIPFSSPMPTRRIGLVWRKTSARQAVVEQLRQLMV